jgi:hypothetical protein
MSWMSVPPAATFSTCAPRQIASTGKIASQRFARQRELVRIARVVRLDRRVAILAVDGWRDIDSAGEEQPVAVCERIRQRIAGREFADPRAGVLERRPVVRFEPGRADQRSLRHLYILDGTPHPMRSSAFVSCLRTYSTPAARQRRACSRSSFRICCRW